MQRKRARIPDDTSLDQLLQAVVEKSRRPKVDLVAFLLSYYAGLRVQEIAGLRWKDNIFTPDGRFDVQVIRSGANTVKVATLLVSSDIGKGGKARTLSMNPRLFDAMRDLWEDPDREDSPFVVPSGNNRAGQQLVNRAHALTMRLNRMYKALGMDGMSTHIGRRRFITRLARNRDLSLRDVQHLAGHADIGTTERYIEITDQQMQAVAML